jgi:hypothetical protein
MADAAQGSGRTLDAPSHGERDRIADHDRLLKVKR